MTIRTNQPHAKVLGVALSFLVTLTACGGNKQQQESASQTVTVVTQSLTSDNIIDSSEYLGRVEAQDRVKLASRVDGRITSIAAREGDRVKRGQTIVQLQQTREQAQVNAAVSQVNIIQADLVNAQAQVAQAEAEVAQAQAEVGQAQADLRQQEADVALAKTNIDRAKFLVKEGAESTQYLDDRTQELDAAMARRDAAIQALDASKKALTAAQEGVRAAIANVDRQRAGLSQARANVGVASQDLEFNRVVAPIDGIVGNIVPKAGDYIEAGDQITTITSNDNLVVNIGVPVEQASRLSLGLPVEILGRGEGNRARGRITFVSPTTTQQSVLVEATVNSQNRLQDEQSVLARVIWSETPGVLIPTTARSQIAGQNFVFVAEEVEQEGETTLVAKQKIVQLGDIQGQQYQVISGLEPGERLITSGILNLTDGAAITIEESVSSK